MLLRHILEAGIALSSLRKKKKITKKLIPKKIQVNKERSSDELIERLADMPELFDLLTKRQNKK